MANALQKLPERTVERLSEYRRALLKRSNDETTHIYSHELASIHGITAVQVRRDLMLIGFSTATKKGYNIRDLIAHIEKIMDSEEVTNVAIIGMGNIATAVTTYFHEKRKKLKITVSFDSDPEKIGTELFGVKCYHIDTLWEKLNEMNVTMLVLTLPAKGVPAIINNIDKANIRGILNFTSATITFPKEKDIFVQDYDIITLLEKVAYYSKIK